VASMMIRRMRLDFHILFGHTAGLLTLCGLSLLFVHFTGSSAHGTQTREQCDACCKNAGYDEYYAEQCKLKCFRNPDHCSLGSTRREASPVAAPAQEAAPEPEQERVKQPPRQSRFVWPNPLNLVPGKEGEAAAQILAVNGISQQHPYYQPALRDIQAVLMEFARNNPTGGRLPTVQLERIVGQLR
jgi:hypothetical protein